MPIFIVTLSLFFSNAFAQTSSTIEFKNDSVQFLMVKTNSDFKFSDRLGDRELKIRECNRAIVEDFWKTAVENISSLQSSLKNPPPSRAWLKFDGVQTPVLPNEKAHAFFQSIPIKSLALFSESHRLCKSR